MNKIMAMLDGKKTFLVAAAAAIVIGLNLAGILDAEMTSRALAILGVTGAVTIRDAIG